MLYWFVTAFFSTSNCVMYSSVLVLISVYVWFFRKKTATKAIPGLRCSRFLLLFSVMRNVYRRSQARPSYFLCVGLKMLNGLCQIFEKERIFRFHFPRIPMVVCFKPDIVEVVLSNTKTLDKARGYEYLHSWLGTGLFTSSGKKWHRRRKLLTPSFHFRILEDFVPVFNEQSNVLVSKINELQHCEWIDIVPLVTFCSLDMICETAMGVPMNAQNGGRSDYVQAIHGLANGFLLRMIKPWLYSDFIFNRTACGRNFNENVNICKNFTRKVIKEKKEQLLMEARTGRPKEINSNEHLARNKKRVVFLELLLEHHLKDLTLTEEDVREEVETFIIAGHDTTSMCLSWTLYCLGLEVEVQHQVHRELDEIFRGDKERIITREDVTRMKYLECVIKETLRLYPTVPFIARAVKESFNLMDYTVERGNFCLILTCMLHRDPKSFPDPEKFDPLRFSPENSVGRHPYAFVPFSAGPRNCIGQKFAMLEVKVVLANILRHFSVTSRDSRDRVNTYPSIVLRNLEPLRMRFTPRSA